MFAVVALMWLMQLEPCHAQAEPYMAMAAERADAFDLAQAAAAAFAGAGYGCPEAEIAGHYLRGLEAARRAYRDGGSPASLAAAFTAAATLDSLSARHPALAPIAHAVLRAAIAAAQSERDEMTVLLDHALRMESLQLEAGQSGLPLVTAHVVAGDLWLQVHGFDEARRAYERAEQRAGPSPRIAIGLARAAGRVKDVDTACRRYRQVISVWQAALERTAELEEARTYVAHPSCGRPSGQ